MILHKQIQGWPQKSNSSTKWSKVAWEIQMHSQQNSARAESSAGTGSIAGAKSTSTLQTSSVVTHAIISTRRHKGDNTLSHFKQTKSFHVDTVTWSSTHKGYNSLPTFPIHAQGGNVNRYSLQKSLLTQMFLSLCEDFIFFPILFCGFPNSYHTWHVLFCPNDRKVINL